MNDGAGTALLAVVVLVAAVALATRELTPPPAAGTDAPPAEFSAARAHATVAALAREPHPIGTPAHRAAREELLARLVDVGVTPEVQETVAVWPRGGAVQTALVRNVLARLPGRLPGAGTVLLAAHYDSVGSGPGAGDDAAGVAALVETARALRAGPPLDRDVLLLITDGEEVGLMGARAFVAEHEAAADVVAVVNLEARGHRGPAILFETAGASGALVRAAAAALPNPVASSAAVEVYRRMPNDTDLTVFRAAGLRGLNFAFIGGLDHYHTALDTPANLDLCSLQHHGEAALSLARRLGQAEVATAAPDRVFFSVLRLGIVHHPLGLALPLAGLAVVLLLFGIAVLRRRGWLTWRGLAGGLLGAVVAGITSVCAGLAIRGPFTPAAGPFVSDPAFLYDGPVVMAALLLIALSLHAIVLRQVLVRTTLDAAWAGALLLPAVAAVGLAVAAPGASYLMVFALLFAAAGLGLLALRRRRGRLGIPGVLLAGAAAFPGLALGVPVTWLAFESLTLQGAAAVLAFASLLIGLTTPLLAAAMAVRGWWLPLASGLAGGLLLVAAVLAGGPSPSRPAWDSVFYAVDPDAGEAFFGSYDAEPDVYTLQFLNGPMHRAPIPSFRPDSRRVPWRAPAPALPLDGPRLELLGLEVEADARRARVRCHVPAGTRRLTLQVVAPQAEWTRFLTVGGHPVDVAATTLIHDAPPPDGLDLELALQARGAARVVIVAQVDGLPAEIEATERPPHLIPAPLLPDVTLIRRAFDL